MNPTRPRQSSRARIGTIAAAAALAMVVLPAVGAASASAAPSSGWSSASAHPAARSGQTLALHPSASKAYSLTSATLNAELDKAPLENTPAAAGKLPVISIPGPDGALHQFTVVESPVMEPALARKVSTFKSYAVKGVDDPTASGRIDFSNLGFHASIRSELGAWYVDPAYRNSKTSYLSYDGHALTPDVIPAETKAKAAAGHPAANAVIPAGSLVKQRVYRLALANEPAYAAYFGSANVDAAKALVVNRTDQIYNDDLAIKFVLVAGNDQLNFDTAAKFQAAGYAASDSECPAVALDHNQAAIDAIIPPANYDVGHIVVGGNGGGVASQGVGVDGQKAKGCSGTSVPDGDILAVEFFAHEVGHQFSAQHTFNSAVCEANRSAASAIEPASGTSVMSYPGVCGADNLQPFSDPYFSQFSIAQIQSYVTGDLGIPGATNGGTVTQTTNHSPVVAVPGTSYIPARTPFTLAGSATDADSNPLTYVWEQNDLGGPLGVALFDNNKPNRPIFRTFSTASIPLNYETYNSPGEGVPTADGNKRTFPDIAQIAVGNTNAASGSCPAPSPEPTAAQIDCFSEFLPTTARALHFDLTARDRYLSGGGVSTDETVVNVVGTTPFRVSTATPSTVGASRSTTLTWNVAGTTAAPVSVANVRILYSTDGGLTFPTVVLASTPNDGSQALTVPNTATKTGRFKVEAIGQPFFDISHTNLVVDTVAPTCVVTAVRPKPNAQQDVTVRDTGTGLASITNRKITNGTIQVPPFAVGTTGPVVLTASKTNQAVATTWSFDVTDVAGNVKHCA